MPKTHAPTGAAYIAARLRDLAIIRDPHFTIGRLRGASIEAVAARLAEKLGPNPSEDTLVSALGRFKSQYPMHFRDFREVESAIRAAKQPKPLLIDDIDRKSLAKLTPTERPNFANSGELPNHVRIAQKEEKADNE